MDKELLDVMKHYRQQGHTYSDIAEYMDISVETVNYHLNPSHKKRKKAYNKKRYEKERNLIKYAKDKLNINI